MDKKTNIVTFFVISILGTLMHFIYDLTKKNFIVGLISPVNESIWEHQKLLFFPSVIVLIILYFIKYKDIGNYLQAVTVGIMSGIFSIIALFYLYSGILGFTITFVDITLYYIGVIITLFVMNLIIKNKFLMCKSEKLISVAVLIIITVIFFVFTVNPPQISLFIEEGR